VSVVAWRALSQLLERALQEVRGAGWGRKQPRLTGTAQQYSVPAWQYIVPIAVQCACGSTATVPAAVQPLCKYHQLFVWWCDDVMVCDTTSCLCGGVMM